MSLLAIKFIIVLKNNFLLSKQKRMLFFIIIVGLAGVVIGSIVIVSMILRL